MFHMKCIFMISFDGGCNYSPQIITMQKQIDAQPKPVAPQPQTARQAANVNAERARPVDRSK